MKCPRCGGGVQTFTLSGNEASVCESCLYVGVTADHRPEADGETESWTEALARFHGANTVEEPTEGGTPADSDDDSESDAPSDEAGEP